MDLLGQLKRRNERVFEFLGPAQLQELVRMVTNVMLRSQSIMYELLLQTQDIDQDNLDQVSQSQDGEQPMV